MKLIIQIPCLNEEETLPLALTDLPREIPGIDVIEYMVIVDGSSDRTQQVAREHGVHHIVNFRRNRGLAKAFMAGINTGLRLGADIIVNTDADNQYCGADIPKLVEPIVAGRADLVIGDRQTQTIGHFSVVKKLLQKHGSRTLSKLAGVEIPDATSGFRAFSRNALLELNVISSFSYTMETLIQAGTKSLAIECVPIRTNGKLRESRLFRSMNSFVRKSMATMIRVYATHAPLKVFLSAAVFFFLLALIPFGRFTYFLLQGESGGRIQSLLLGVVLFVTSGFLATTGLLAELVSANRKLLEELLHVTRDRRDLESIDGDEI